jgi:hypothetical protein
MESTHVERARSLFREAGLSFPRIPIELAECLREQGDWIFSTREIAASPYNLQHYLAEFSQTRVADYAILSHSGHGVNSYALQYYVVRGGLGIFLHLGWGGVYMDNKEESAKIGKCFSLTDRILSTKPMGSRSRTAGVIVVASDFYGSFWSKTREYKVEHGEKSPIDVLTEVSEWLAGRGSQ